MTALVPPPDATSACSRANCSSHGVCVPPAATGGACGSHPCAMPCECDYYWLGARCAEAFSEHMGGQWTAMLVIVGVMHAAVALTGCGHLAWRWCCWVERTTGAVAPPRRMVAAALQRVASGKLSVGRDTQLTNPLRMPDVASGGGSDSPANTSSSSPPPPQSDAVAPASAPSSHAAPAVEHNPCVRIFGGCWGMCGSKHSRSLGTRARRTGSFDDRVTAMVVLGCIGRLVWLIDPVSTRDLFAETATPLLLRLPQVLWVSALLTVIHFWNCVADAISPNPAKLKRQRRQLTALAFAVFIGAVPASLLYAARVWMSVTVVLSSVVLTFFSVGITAYGTYFACRLYRVLDRASRRRGAAAAAPSRQQERFLKARRAVFVSVRSLLLLGGTMALVVTTVVAAGLTARRFPTVFLWYMAYVHVAEALLAAALMHATHPGSANLFNTVRKLVANARRRVARSVRQLSVSSVGGGGGGGGGGRSGPMASADNVGAARAGGRDGGAPEPMPTAGTAV